MKLIVLLSFILIRFSLPAFSQHCDKANSLKKRAQIYQTNQKGELLYIVLLKTHRKKFLWHGTYNSTGAFIHPRVLITAGHNLYNKRTNVVDILIRVGATHEDSFLIEQKINTEMYKNIYVLPSYNRNRATQEDIGIIILPDSTLFRRAGGHFKINAYSSAAAAGLKKIRITGYPGPNAGIKLWHDNTANFKAENGTLKYDFFTEKGSSGSPVYSDAGEIVAIHTLGVEDMKQCNTATMLTPELITEIRKWCAENKIELGY